MHQDYRIGIETCMMFLFCIVKISHSFTTSSFLLAWDGIFIWKAQVTQGLLLPHWQAHQGTEISQISSSIQKHTLDFYKIQTIDELQLNVQIIIKPKWSNVIAWEWYFYAHLIFLELWIWFLDLDLHVRRAPKTAPRLPAALLHQLETWI